MSKLILNGIEYANNKADGYPPIIYSDEEREVGVWRDGKPLYEKTVDFGALPNATTKQVNHNISDIDKVITFDITAYNSTSNIFIKAPHVTTSSLSSATANQLQSVVTKTYISIGSGIDYSTYTQSWVTLQYTKTTDVAGSGKWTTQGTPTHHYSTTEQVIGTWIDGKPLYEKTWTFSSSVGVNWNDTGIPIGDIKQLIMVKLYNNIGTCFMGAASIDHSTIYINYANASYYADGMTLQYTKTTD